MLMTLLAATTMVVAADPVTEAQLYPVESGNAVLQADDTFVSDTAATFISDNAFGTLHCLEMPEGRSEHARVCLTSGEWQQVFDRIGEQQARGEQQRAISQATRFADNRSTAVTP